MLKRCEAVVFPREFLDGVLPRFAKTSRVLRAAANQEACKAPSMHAMRALIALA